MTETEQMEKHITTKKRLGEVLQKSMGSDYHAVSLELGGEFSPMPHQERLTGIPDDVAWARLETIQPVFAGGARD